MRATSLTFTCGDCCHSAAFSTRVVERWLAIPPYEALIASDVDRLRSRLVCTACRSRNVTITTDEEPPLSQQPSVAQSYMDGARGGGASMKEKRTPAPKPAPSAPKSRTGAPKRSSPPSGNTRTATPPLQPRRRPPVDVPPQRLTKDQERIRAELDEIEKRRAQRALARAQAQEKMSVPEYEEGMPRPGWFTDEDWRKLHPGRR